MTLNDPQMCKSVTWVDKCNCSISRVRTLCSDAIWGSREKFCDRWYEIPPVKLCKSVNHKWKWKWIHECIKCGTDNAQQIKIGIINDVQLF